MRLSNLYIPTLKEDPAEAEVVSHRLLLRAGLIRKVAAGIYSFLPLGQRVLGKVITIIREEMSQAGAQEVLLPALHPAELWRETQRWEKYGPEMMRLKDRHERDFCLGPTHEEIITDLVRGEVRSYKQLPVNLFQVQAKFRDEPRPRFGLLRGREFIMKDGYSFDRDEAGLKDNYEAMYRAYDRILARCGLKFRVVEAATGIIGGDVSHEFMVLAETGEDRIVYCTSCDYAANREIARRGDPEPQREEPKALTSVTTPGRSSVEEVSSYLGVAPERLAKTLIYRRNGALVAVLVPGNREANVAKLARVLQAEPVLIKEGEFAKHGLVPGFVGPAKLPDFEIIADYELKGHSNLVVGANEPDTHYTNANVGRDFEVDRWADITYAQAGESCPLCGGTLDEIRGIEAGQIFQLGTKYSEAMGATFVDEDGKEKPFVMGCYGIGVSRLLAATIEQNHDEKGIKWPLSLAPYQVIILALKMDEPPQKEISEKLYEELKALGIEVVLDDRMVSPGIKFAEADLIGYPIQVVVGDRTLESGTLEIKLRFTGEKRTAAMAEGAATIARLVESGLADSGEAKNDG